MAKDMANRYLQQMEIFNRRRLNNLADLLSTEPETISPSKREQLRASVDVMQRRCGVSAIRRHELEAEVDRYSHSSGETGDDMRLAMLSILFARYAKRVPQRNLFEVNAPDIEPAKPLIADADIAEGAPTTSTRSPVLFWSRCSVRRRLRECGAVFAFSGTPSVAFGNPVNSRQTRYSQQWHTTRITARESRRDYSRLGLSTA
jgi:hypothetical protein